MLRKLSSANLKVEKVVKIAESNIDVLMVEALCATRHKEARIG